MTCNHKNPLKRGGTSQSERLLNSLRPEYVSVDEKSTTDLIRYAIEYSEFLKYYDLDNNVDGNWREFLEKDITTLIAEIASFNYSQNKEEFAAKIQVLWDDALNPPVNLNNFREIFLFIFDQALTIDGWLQRTLPASRLNSEIGNGILPTLRSALIELIAYDKRAEAQFTSYTANSYSGLSSFWNIDPGSVNYNDYPNIYGTGSDDEQILNALDPNGAGNPNSNAFWNIYLAYYKQYIRLSDIVPELLEESLSSDEGHAPHTALLLTFLELFRHGQDYMNTLTKRHLDFYYKDVLRLSEKEAVPDQVHVIFELAKNLNQGLVKNGADLLDGKDELGKDIFFEVAEDIVVNKATIQSLRTVFLRKIRVLNPIDCSVSEKVRNIYEAPVANSADGLGEAFDGKTKWAIVGETQHNKAADMRTMVDATLGFAFASPVFFLSEGNRMISLKLAFGSEFLNRFYHPIYFDQLGINTASGAIPSSAEENQLQDILINAFTFEVTGEEGWILPDTKSVVINKTKNALEFEITLDGEKPPVVAYNGQVHEGTLGTQWPVVRCFLDTTSYAEYYEYLRDLQLKNAQLEVCVTSMKNLSIQNDEGELDPTKPFLPFSSRPVPGSSFYIGNAEIFSKNLTSMKVNVEWFDPPSDFDEYYEDYKLKDQSSSPVSGNETFKAKVKVLKDFYWQELDYGSTTAPTHNCFFDLKLLPENQIPSPSPVIQTATVSPVIKPVKAPGLAAITGITQAAPITPKYTAVFEPVSAPYNYELTPGKGFVLNTNNLLGEKGVELFNRSNAKSAHTLSIYNPSTSSTEPYTADSSELYELGLDRDPFLKELPTLGANPKQGYMKLELNAPGFLHKEYPDLITKKLYEETLLSQSVIVNTSGSEKIDTQVTLTAGPDTTDITIDSSLKVETTDDNELTPPLELPPPYTPKVKAISMDYSAAVCLDFSTTDYLANDIDQVYLLYPFGDGQTQPVPPGLFGGVGYKKPAKIIESNALLPQFKVGGKLSEGNLYVGLADVVAPQVVTILFQLFEGSGDPDLEIPEILWSYLSDNVWKDFETSEIISDTTKGFRKSGILKLNIPRSATTDDTIMPGSYIWLKASTVNNSVALPFAIDVLAQAALAVFDDRDNDPERLRDPLPPESVTDLSPKNFSISSVLQPFASFGGRVKEEEGGFYTRVSERLRHKYRAITIWDYERLVLEKFPDIYKVKCINHTNTISERAPGNVMITVIPNLKNVESINPLEPKVDVGTLTDIHDFIREINPPCAELVVRNPEYEKIKLRFRVYFKDGFDENYYKTLLNTELVTFLSPWASNEISEIRFGGKIYRSELLDFVEERTYVDFVTDFEMFHINNENVIQDVSVAEVTSADSILVSVPLHEIITDIPPCQ